MDDLAPLPIGRRVAAFRKLRGLTQAGLATRLHRSESWVRKIERGERRIDSLTVLGELSRALAVPVYQLTGQYELPLGRTGSRGTTDLAGLRSVLDRPVIASLPSGEPRPVARLEREAAALGWRYSTAIHHLSAVLPKLAEPIREAEAAVRVAPVVDRPRANAVLAGLYRLAGTGLRHAGDLHRARVALDRALSAAELSGDPLWVGAVAGFHALQVAIEGDGSGGAALAMDVADLLAHEPQVDTPAGAVVFGALHGYAAVGAASAGDESAAWQLLKSASRAAEALGRDRGAYGMYFGPENLATQEMAVLVNLDRPREAVRRVEGVCPSQLGSTSRAGQYHAHLATAYGRCGQDDRAVITLAAGLRAAPELVRQYPLARELVRSLLNRRRHIDGQLRRIVREMKLADGAAAASVS